MHDGKGREAGNERSGLFVDVLAPQDSVDDGRVGARTTDPFRLQLLDEGGFRVAGGWLRGVALGLELAQIDSVPFRHVRQQYFLVRQLRVRVVSTLHVGAQVAGKLDRLAARLKHRFVAAHLYGDPVAAGFRHLAGHRTLPDQFVNLQLEGSHCRSDFFGPLEIARRPDRFVRLLGVLHLGAILPGLRREEVLAIELPDEPAHALDRLVGQGGRVRPHVSDVTVFVEALRCAHRIPRGGTQLAVGLLLQSARGERRRGAARVRLRLDGGDLPRRGLEIGQHGLRLLSGQHDDFGRRRFRRFQLARGTLEVLAGCQSLAVQSHQCGLERGVLRRPERRVQVPVGVADEAPSLALAFHYQAHGDRLDATGREARLDLTPQDRRHLVAVETVEDATGFLRLHEAFIQITRVLKRVFDRLARDLVQYQTVPGHLGFENLQKVPADRLPFSVPVRGQVHCARLLEETPQARHLLLLLRWNDVNGLEIVFDIDPESSPRLVLDGGGDFLGRIRQVPDVAYARFHQVILGQEVCKRPRLGRGLDDD